MLKSRDEVLGRHRTIFLANDTPVTKSYLKFLIEKIVVTGSSIRIFTRSEAVVRMMAATNGASGTAIASNPEISPSFEVGWLPVRASRLKRENVNALS